MSALTPPAVLALALGGAFLVELLARLMAGDGMAGGAIVRDVVARLREPISRPETYDPWLFHLAPGLLLLSAVVALAMVPWTPGFRGIDLEAGVILFPAALAYVTPAVFMAGWGAGRPLAVVGGFRFVALMLGYAMPLAMVATAVAAPAESLRPVMIVRAQHAVPFALVQPYSLALWLPAAMAVALVPPLDLALAGGDLQEGVFARYTGWEAALVELARRVLLLAVCGMTAALFLAGWQGPLLAPAVWMAIKTAGVVCGLLWVGRRFPRPPVALVVSLAWKVAIPAAIGAIVLAGLTTLVFYR